MPCYQYDLAMILYWLNWIEIKYCCSDVEALIHYHMWKQGEAEQAGLLQPGEEQGQENKNLSSNAYVEVIKKTEAGPFCWG